MTSVSAPVSTNRPVAATTGCAAANGNNGVGVAGVGWDLSHRMLRVSNSSGGGAYSCWKAEKRWS